MLRRVALLIPLVLAAGSVRADEWRFCVGVAPSSHETVISDIFASAADPGRLEHKLETYFRARRAKTLTFQCPRGGDRLAALNGQTAALQFNRTLGYAINGLPSSEVAVALGEDLF